MGKRALVVDDHPEMVRLIEEALVREEFSVASAGNGPDCLRQVDARRPDLIVLDVMMPGMDGFQSVVREYSSAALRASTGLTDGTSESALWCLLALPMGFCALHLTTTAGIRCQNMPRRWRRPSGESIPLQDGKNLRDSWLLRSRGSVTLHYGRPRPLSGDSTIRPRPVLGGLHHEYCRAAA